MAFEFSLADWKIQTHRIGMNGRYLWGSAAPFVSWIDDSITYVFTYVMETKTLRALPQGIGRSMSDDAPTTWLYN